MFGKNAIEVADRAKNMGIGSVTGLYLDNIPNWEFGALVQVRDFARAFREDFSRSQSQSTESSLNFKNKLIT